MRLHWLLISLFALFAAARGIGIFCRPGEPVPMGIPVYTIQGPKLPAIDKPDVLYDRTKVMYMTFTGRKGDVNVNVGTAGVNLVVKYSCFGKKFNEAACDAAYYLTLASGTKNVYLMSPETMYYSVCPMLTLKNAL